MTDSRLGTQIIKYEKMLASKPKSIVFAPLAESYCGMGMFDKAMNVLKKGIRYNPSYIPGYVALAKSYQMQGEGQLAYTTLRPLVNQHRDNIKLQYLFAQISEEIQCYEDALDTYRYLQFLNSNDAELKDKIKKLEETTMSEIVSDEDVQFDVQGIDDDVEEWEQFDFVAPGESSSLNEVEEDDEEEEWVAQEASVSDETDKVNEKSQEPFKDEAFFTHTLVKLYLDQGHREKGIEILNKILELKPGDEKTLKMLQDIQNIDDVSEDITPDENGHDALSASLDEVIGQDTAPELPESFRENAVDETAALSDFLEEIRARYSDKM